MLVDANAEGADFSNSKFERSVLLGARLRRADFTGVVMERTVLLNVAAEDSTWRGSRLTRVQAGGTASFVRADCSDMTASQCGWRGSDFRDAKLARSQLVMCDFGTCRMDGVDLSGALLWRSLFMQASLRNGRLEHADFLQALCRKIDLRGSALHSTHLLQTDLSEAVLEDPPTAGEAAT
jgi:uncharacterized protein YjbI with pentapeptide repeats